MSLLAPAMVVGAAHGALAGYRRIYPWRHSRGIVAFALDHTWALVMSTASVLSQVVGLTRRDSVYVAPISERQARHVYAGGLRVRRGFAITLGSTVSGLADASERRWALVTDHEDVHVWQARWLGPLFPVLYVGWTIAGGAFGLAVALAGRRRPVAKTVETYAYYDNPFEWWAYSREGRWPPRTAGRGTWRRPMVAPFSAKRGGRAARR